MLSNLGLLRSGLNKSLSIQQPLYVDFAGFEQFHSLFNENKKCLNKLLEHSEVEIFR